ncbi:MAG: hypothetical protein ACM3SY_01120 [Candidatus Omnitrophota bacterium]
MKTLQQSSFNEAVVHIQDFLDAFPENDLSGELMEKKANAMKAMKHIERILGRSFDQFVHPDLQDPTNASVPTNVKPLDRASGECCNRIYGSGVNRSVSTSNVKPLDRASGECCNRIYGSGVNGSVSTSNVKPLDRASGECCDRIYGSGVNGSVSTSNVKPLDRASGECCDRIYGSGV